VAADLVEDGPAPGGDEPEIHTITDPDGETIFVYRWGAAVRPRAVVHVLHGLGEHSRRYDRLAAALNAAGYTVYADDHRASGRTGTEGAGLGQLGPRGMAGALDAVHAVTGYIRDQHPGLGVYLLGHSWGSFLAQRFADRWGTELAGLLLSGSTLMAEPYISLEEPNRRFEPASTPYDWLSRDPIEVQRYIDDQWSGFEVSFEVAELLHLAAEPAATVPKDLPVLVLNGDEDVVGGFNGGGVALAEAYGALGLSDVTTLVYKGGRHELFNETNRDEVTADVIGWLDTRTG
jgi:alpha-beta hydrolase superfamily lysophospholipase